MHVIYVILPRTKSFNMYVICVSMYDSACYVCMSGIVIDVLNGLWWFQVIFKKKNLLTFSMFLI